MTDLSENRFGGLGEGDSHACACGVWCAVGRVEGDGVVSRDGDRELAAGDADR